MGVPCQVAPPTRVSAAAFTLDSGSVTFTFPASASPVAVITTGTVTVSDLCSAGPPAMVPGDRGGPSTPRTSMAPPGATNRSLTRSSPPKTSSTCVGFAVGITMAPEVVGLQKILERLEQALAVDLIFARVCAEVADERLIAHATLPVGCRDVEFVLDVGNARCR